MEKDHIIVNKKLDTIIIGDGLSGPATGYHLQKFKEDFIIIDAARRDSDSWLHRWDSYHLFTPSQYYGVGRDACFIASQFHHHIPNETR